MAAPQPPTRTLLKTWEPHVEARPVATRLFRCEARLSCYDFQKQALTNRPYGILISPGDPYSILPPVFKRSRIRIYTETIPGEPTTSWCGVLCHFVRAKMGLPVMGHPGLRILWLLALRPTKPMEDLPAFLRLGAQFFDANNASLALSWEHGSGELVIP